MVSEFILRQGRVIRRKWHEERNNVSLAYEYEGGAIRTYVHTWVNNAAQLVTTTLAGNIRIRARESL